MTKQCFIDSKYKLDPPLSQNTVTDFHIFGDSIITFTENPDQPVVLYRFDTDCKQWIVNTNVRWLSNHSVSHFVSTLSHFYYLEGGAVFVIPKDEPSSSPDEVEFESEASVIQSLSASESVVFALDVDGVLYSFGQGCNLGLVSASKTAVFRKVQFLLNWRVVSVNCGKAHTVVIAIPRQHHLQKSTSICPSCGTELFSFVETDDSVVIQKHDCSKTLTLQRSWNSMINIDQWNKSSRRFDRRGTEPETKSLTSPKALHPLEQKEDKVPAPLKRHSRQKSDPCIVSLEMDTFTTTESKPLRFSAFQPIGRKVNEARVNILNQINQIPNSPVNLMLKNAWNTVCIEASEVGSKIMGENSEDYATLLSSSTSSYSFDDHLDIADDSYAHNLDYLEQWPLENEVWSWGLNDHGQLGLEDFMNRPQPTLIETLKGKAVVQIACSSYHTLALTATSTIYAWGKNNLGQLVYSEPVSSIPHEIHLPANAMPFEIAANDACSLILCEQDAKSVCFRCGILPEEKEKVTTMQFLCEEHTISQLGYVHSLRACEAVNGCLFFDKLNQPGRIMWDYLWDERRYIRQLFQIMNTISESELAGDVCSPTNVNTPQPLAEQMDLLMKMFKSVTSVSCWGYRTALNVFQSSSEHLMLEQFPLVVSIARYMDILGSYGKTYVDAVSIGLFRHLGKFYKPQLKTMEDVLKSFAAIIGVDASLPNLGLLLSQVLQLPVLRLKVYVRILQEFRDIDSDLVDRPLKLLTSLRHRIKSEYELAEGTRTFWESNSKLKSLKVGNRRFLRDTNDCRTASGACKLVLFDDSLILVQGSAIYEYPLSLVWLDLSANGNDETTLHVITPESHVTMASETAREKTEWFHILTNAVNDFLHNRTSKESWKSKSTGVNFTPITRYASYTFRKNPVYQGATFTGTWKKGNMDGCGVINYLDGRTFSGQFRNNCEHGLGELRVHTPSGVEVWRGQFVSGLLNGPGTVRFANNDKFEGNFLNGLKSGFGRFDTHMVRVGRRESCHYNRTYIGEFSEDKRNGYGVLIDKAAGDKYFGMWCNDVKQGMGVLLTPDRYFEGTFVQGKVSGPGLVLLHDGTSFEGDFNEHMNISGKGLLTTANGDMFEGTFSGCFEETIKCSGLFIRNAVTPSAHIKFEWGLNHGFPRSFQKLSVPAFSKWKSIFTQCLDTLGASPELQIVNRRSIAWENIAKSIESFRQYSTMDGRSSADWDSLTRIPDPSDSKLTSTRLNEIKTYLEVAFKHKPHPVHPFGILLSQIVDAFGECYHEVDLLESKLLYHAVDEIHSLVERVYDIIRIVFPELPVVGVTLSFSNEAFDQFYHASLVYAYLVPAIHPYLHSLYMFHDRNFDNIYHSRISRLNRQSDYALMMYLDLDQKFGLVVEKAIERTNQKATIMRGVCFADASSELRLITTRYTPEDKMLAIHSCFKKIFEELEACFGMNCHFGMDDLLPLCIFVVVRGSIKRLGAELHMLEDLLLGHISSGELGLMYTTIYRDHSIHS